MASDLIKPRNGLQCQSTMQIVTSRLLLRKLSNQCHHNPFTNTDLSCSCSQLNSWGSVLRFSQTQFGIAVVCSCTQTWALVMTRCAQPHCTGCWCLTLAQGGFCCWCLTLAQLHLTPPSLGIKEPVIRNNPFLNSNSLDGTFLVLINQGLELVRKQLSKIMFYCCAFPCMPSALICEATERLFFFFFLFLTTNLSLCTSTVCVKH